MNADLIREYPWHPWQSVCPNLLWFDLVAFENDHFSRRNNLPLAEKSRCLARRFGYIVFYEEYP
jgi:hypothetical protein